MTDLKHPPDNWLRDDPATKGFVPPTQVIRHLMGI